MTSYNYVFRPPGHWGPIKSYFHGDPPGHWDNIKLCFRGGPGLAPARALARAWFWAWVLKLFPFVFPWGTMDYMKAPPRPEGS